MRQMLTTLLGVIACTAAALAQPQGGPSHTRTMADGKAWTTRNLDVTSVASFCYDDDQGKCRLYGRLYTWEAARQACPTLGAGWRLPTDDDWRRLAQQYGGASGDDGRLGPEAYEALLMGGRAGFDAVLSGGRSGEGEYSRADAHGFYWTSTEMGPQSAVFYNFGKGSRGLYRQLEGEKVGAFAVRCIKD